MKFFELILSERRGENCYEGIHKRFIKAKNRDNAYNKSLIVAANFYNNYKGATTGIPDKDMIFYFNNNFYAIWINSLKELEVI